MADKTAHPVFQETSREISDSNSKSIKLLCIDWEKTKFIPKLITML